VGFLIHWLPLSGLPDKVLGQQFSLETPPFYIFNFKKTVKIGSPNSKRMKNILSSIVSVCVIIYHIVLGALESHTFYKTIYFHQVFYIFQAHFAYSCGCFISLKGRREMQENVFFAFNIKSVWRVFGWSSSWGWYTWCLGEAIDDEVGTWGGVEVKALCY